MMPTTTGRDDGEKVAVAASTRPGSWLPTVQQELDRIILSRRLFTADQLRDRLPAEAREWLDTHGDTYAALFGAAARAGHIEPHGWVTSKRPSRRGNPQRIWKGTL